MSECEVCRHTGLDSGFPYRFIPALVDEADLERYCNRQKMRCAKLTKNWSDALNGEWAARRYLAVKMILSASVMLESLEYSKRKNVRIVEPYLCYYAILCCCRCLVFMLPSVPWNRGEITRMRHTKTINLCCDVLTSLSHDLGDTVRREFNYAKAVREMFSYRFPASGIRTPGRAWEDIYGGVVDRCALLAETAQLNSEIMEASSIRHADGDYGLDGEELDSCAYYNLGDDILLDEEDSYRLGYMCRKMRKPYNLLWTMTEGLVEDYFGAWAPEPGNDEDAFDADANWQIIFPVP